MSMHQRQPHALLSPYVQCLWRVERDFRALPDGFDILPDSSIELLFMLGAPGELHDGEQVRAMPRCCLIGLLQRPLRLHADGVVKVLAARFYAWGFVPLLGFAVDQPPQSVQQLGTMMQQLAGSLAHTAAEHGEEAALHQLHTFLLERALQANFSQHELAAAAQLLAAQGGSARIEDLANTCNISRRQMERQFNTAVGISPKMLARTIRFEQARNRLWQAPHSDLATLAAELGYADQAHFTREFKAFSQRTPARFAADMQATRDVLHTIDVAILQDF